MPLDPSFVWHDGDTGGTLVNASRLNDMWQAIIAANAPADGCVYVTDYASLDAALDAAASSATVTRIVVVAGSTITLTNANTLTIDVGFAYVDFQGCTVNATAMTTGIALNVYGSVSPPYTQTSHGFDNLVLVGPGKAVTGVTGVSFNGVSTTVDHGPSHLQPQHCNVSAFETGVTYGINGYCIDLLNWDIYRCADGIKIPTGLPTGERLSYTNCVVFNNTVGLNVASSGDLDLFNCSFDYNTDAHIKQGSYQIDATSCHFESGTKSTPDFVLTGNGSRLHLFGGSWTNTQSPTWTAAILNNANNGGGVFIDGTHLGGLSSTSGYLATGTGITQVRNTTGYDIADTCEMVADTADLLADGGFTQASINDRWYIASDTATIGTSNQYAGANISMGLDLGQHHSGTQSLRMTKTGGVGSAAAIYLSIPIPLGQRPRLRFWYTKPGTQTGTVFITVRYAVAPDQPSNGLPRVLQGVNIKQTSLTLTSSTIGWTEWVLTEPTLRTPMWATHLSLEFGFVSMAAGDFYVDDVEASTL
jgi:hypothetical protein